MTKQSKWRSSISKVSLAISVFLAFMGAIALCYCPEIFFLTALFALVPVAWGQGLQRTLGVIALLIGIVGTVDQTLKWRKQMERSRERQKTTERSTEQPTNVAAGAAPIAKPKPPFLHL